MAVRGTLLFLLPAIIILTLAGCQADEGDFTSQGTAGEPASLGPAPIPAFAGSVGAEASSFYRVGVNDQTSYTVTLSQLLNDADLLVFDDSGFSNSFCVSAQSGTTSEVCSETTEIGITDLYIQIKPFTTLGTSFLLTVQ